MQELTNRDLGEWEGRHALEVWEPTNTLPYDCCALASCSELLHVLVFDHIKYRLIV